MSDRNDGLARAKNLLIFAAVVAGFVALIFFLGTWLSDDASGIARSAHLLH
jgi:hypothetical protein